MSRKALTLSPIFLPFLADNLQHALQGFALACEGGGEAVRQRVDLAPTRRKHKRAAEVEKQQRPLQDPQTQALVQQIGQLLLDT